MKILQVLRDYLPEHVGGAEVHTHQIARVLSGRGHEVVCLYTAQQSGTKDGTRRERTLDGIRLIECVRRLEYSDVQESWRQERGGEIFQEVLELEQPDVVHFQHFERWGTACLSRARAFGCATAVTLHDYFLLCDRTTLLDVDGELCSPTSTRRCTGCLAQHPFEAPRWRHEEESECHRIAMTERLAYHRHYMQDAQRVIVPSAFLADAMLRAEVIAQEGLVELKAGYPGPLRETRSPRAQGPLRVGYVGSLSHAKGVHVLIEAMHFLAGEPIELSIHGPLAWFPEYVAELRAAAVGYPVTFCGRFAPEDVDRVLASVDVIAVPSLWYETMPLTIHEAWRNGVPVVASDLGGMSECVTHETNGLLFPPGDASALADALATLAEDPTFALRLAKGRPMLATVEGVVERLEGLYRDCLEEAGDRR